MYGNETTLSTLLGERLMETLATLTAGSVGSDTSATVSEVITAARAAADAEIDAAVSRRYPSGFADIDATPDTPDLIQRVSNLLTASNLLITRHAGTDEQVAYRDEAERILLRIAKGDYVLAGITEADHDSGSAGVRRSVYAVPKFSGLDDDDDDRMDVW